MIQKKLQRTLSRASDSTQVIPSRFSSAKKSLRHSQDASTIQNGGRKSFRVSTQGKSAASFLHSSIVATKNTQETFEDALKTPYDNDMLSFQFCSTLGYRYKSKEPEIMRKEHIQNFIFQKKKQNKLKYSSNSRINKTALPVSKGTVSVMLNIQRKDYGFQLSSFKKKVPQRSKYKMKWKTIQWLLNNRQDAIQQIFNNYQLILRKAREKKKGLSRAEFGEILSFVGLGADPNLADKLFFEQVDYKELIVGLEIFKESSIDDKMIMFIELCDTDLEGRIYQKEFYNIFKQIFVSADDKLKLKRILEKIFVGGVGIMKNQLMQMVLQHEQLRSLLEESIRNVKSIDRLIENDLQEPFNAYVPASTNFVNYKEGIFFPEMEKILRAIEEVENIYDARNIQQKLFRRMFKDDEETIAD